MFNFLQKRIGGVHLPATIIVFMTILSYLISLVRVNFLTTNFGIGEELDLFLSAFKIPDLIFIFIGSLITSLVLIPFFTKKENDHTIAHYIDILFTVYFYVLSVVAIIVFIFTPQIQGVIFPGFSPEQQEIVTILTRIMLVQPILLSISYLFSSVIQVWRRFFIYALSPIFYNLGIIFGIVFLYPYFDIYGVAIGVVIGAVLHLLFPLVSIIKSGIVPKLKMVKKQDLIEIINLAKISIPRTVSISFFYITQLVAISIATLFNEGSVTIFQLSFDLYFVPIAIISISYSIASFPYLSKLFFDNDIEKFKDIVIDSIRYIVFLSLPIMILFIILRENIVQVVFGIDAFSDNELKLTALSLSVLIISIISAGLVQVVSRAFYAARNTIIPFFVNLFVMVFSLGSLFIFWLIFTKKELWESIYVGIFDINLEGSEILVLPLIISFFTILGSVVLLFIFSKKFSAKIFTKLSNSFIQHIFATMVLGVVGIEIFNVTLTKFNQLSEIGLFMHGIFVGLVASIAWFFTLLVLKNKELLNFLRYIKGIL